MHPVGEGPAAAVGLLGPVALVVFIHVAGAEALVPGEDGTARGPVVLVGEVVFHMALGTDQGALLVAGELVPVLAGTLQPVLERFGVGAQLHGGRIVAVAAADGLVHLADGVLAAEGVHVLGPEGVTVLADPFHHLGGLAVPAGGGQTALFPVAVDAVDVDEVLDGIGVAAGLVVFVHEGIAQPEVLQVGLGVLVALGQGIHVVVLVERHRALVLGHDGRLVVFLVRGVLMREGLLVGRDAGLARGQAGLVFRGLQFGVHVLAAAQQGQRQQGRGRKGEAEESISHKQPSLC